MDSVATTCGFRQFPLGICLFVLAWSFGCAQPWPMRTADESLPMSHGVAKVDLEPPVVATSAPSIVPVVPTASKAAAPVALTSQQQTELEQIIQEVRNSVALDSVAEQSLRGNLLQADPEQWPLVVKQFRSAVAYREDLLTRESNPLLQARETQQKLGTQSLGTQSLGTQTLGGLPAVPRSTTTAKLLEPRMQLQASPTETIRLASHVAPVESPAAELASPIPVAARAAESQIQVATNSTTARAAANVILPTNHVAPSTPSSWQTQLAQTIEALEQEVKPAPGSTDELRDQMQLRILQLVAGQESEALAPLPGATPAEQDYWSKQLFAISTYFDCQRQTDGKQRAAGTLVHLDQARAKLAELATLQVRNLAFVDSVDGFGLYKAHAENKFKPGEQVSLYTEVDNFRSDSTKEGFRTTLATGYEVVDSGGRRVDGAQFPEVEDLCQNRRRDFHMQYGIALPERIYPGEYELRLIITDQLSNKIGQASVKFEIVE